MGPTIIETKSENEIVMKKYQVATNSSQIKSDSKQLKRKLATEAFSPCAMIAYSAPSPNRNFSFSPCLQFFFSTYLVLSTSRASLCECVYLSSISFLFLFLFSVCAFTKFPIPLQTAPFLFFLFPRELVS